MSFDYNKLISDKAAALKPSGIRKFFDILETMSGDVVSLTVGQPDFVTPWHIRVAGIDSLKDGKTYYTSNSGTPELREEIARYLKRRFSLDYDGKTEVLVTVGGSEAIDLAIRAIVEDGDEVIIPDPSYVCYAPMTTLAGGVPVMIKTKEENNFKITPDELRAAITPRTKLLIMPYPNNPTGAIMTREDLLGLADVLRDTNVAVLSDEIYGELTYGRQHCSFAAIEGMKERTILVSGFSKAYAMTGWRLGYLACPPPILKHILKIHQYAIMCAPTTAQLAAIEAMRNGDADVDMMRAEYDRRRAYILGGLRAMGIDCFEPEGAFYVFPNISKFGMTSDEFCNRLLQEEKLAIVPGSAFGESGEGFARLSYAYSLQHIGKALGRIEHFIGRL